MSITTKLNPKHLYILGFCLIIGLPLGSAQQLERAKTEAEVNTEEKFANAQRELLIGRIDKGLTLLEELYREDRENATLAFELAKAYYQKKDLILTEKYAKIATEKDPGNKWMAEFYGEFLLDCGRPGTALAVYQKLNSQHPLDRAYYQNLVDCHLLLEKTQDAINVYHQMEKNLGPDAEIYLSRFELYEKRGDTALAMGQLDALIAKFPGQKSYLKTKARFLISLKRKEEALQLYRQVLTLDAEDTDANLAVLSVGQDSEKPNAYLMALLPVIANPSVNIEAKIAELLPYIQNLARGNNQDVKVALAEIGNKLVLTHPDDARAYSLHGDVLFHSGDMQGAIHRYEQTLNLNDKVFTVWEQLMYAYYEVGDFEKLYTLSYKAIDIFPNQSVNYYFHSLACAAKKQYKPAKETAEEGLIVSGGNPIQVSKLQTAIAIACIGNNDLAAAQTAIDAALAASNHKNGFAVEVQGDLEMARGNGNAAAAFYKKSLELGNTSKALLQKLESFK